MASPNRSFTVRRITEQDIRDIYWMHAVLAGELTLTRRAILLAQTRSPTSPGLRLRTRSAGAGEA